MVLAVHKNLNSEPWETFDIFPLDVYIGCYLILDTHCESISGGSLPDRVSDSSDGSRESKFQAFSDVGHVLFDAFLYWVYTVNLYLMVLSI